MYGKVLDGSQEYVSKSPDRVMEGYSGSNGIPDGLGTIPEWLKAI
uniref:Uncharacterized protein n=1 Tax=Tetraselmis sp. GSL018 TaxID=582737 RepID=A0A061RPG5_9CHLO